jgi:hypothetical protein
MEGRDGGNTARIKTRIENIISMAIFKGRSKLRENKDKFRKKRPSEDSGG